MSDRELLEMAAKAAGYTLKWGEVYIVGDDEVDCTDMPYVVSGQPDEADWHWNPLTDDGDALRLASRLLIDMQFFADDGGFVQAWCWPISDWLREDDLGDFPAATRRAIVRAAAEIGKGMP